MLVLVLRDCPSDGRFVYMKLTRMGHLKTSRLPAIVRY